MKNMMMKLSAAVQGFILRQEGQDLIEYALLASLIALGAVTTMKTLSSDINSAFGNIGTTLNANVG